MKNLILMTCLLLSTFSGLFSQDIIELKSGEKLQVTITKIGLEEIEFRNFGTDPESVVIKLDKYLVKSYEFAGQSVLVFTATCNASQKTALLLRNLGFQAICLHGQMSQPKRLGALNKFKAKQRNILICTDVASR